MSGEAMTRYNGQNAYYIIEARLCSTALESHDAHHRTGGDPKVSGNRTGCRAHFHVQELGRECHGGWEGALLGGVGGSTPWGGSGKPQVGGKGREELLRVTVKEIPRQGSQPVTE